MPTQTARALADREEYLEAVCAANVLTPLQFMRAVESPGRDAPELASALVAAGLLTRFQADRLLSGRSDGFVLGPYLILELVGRGSSSRVYKARHRSMNRFVAIKVLSAELTRTAEDRQRFQDAVRAAGKLSHPNIVTAFDANELQDRFYLVLEFVNGPSLDALVRQRGPLPVAEACEIVRQTTHGLVHAHECGLPHGDLRPGNVLVGRAGASGPPAVKIADFGLPRALTGVPDYLAPERLGGSPATPAADLYALGAVFHFLLTGHPPFQGTADEVVRAHASQAVPRVDRVRPDVRPEIAAIAHRLLAKHPEGRFASAAELLAQLDAACLPVAIPVDGICFELPAASSPQDSGGYLTGRYPMPPGREAYPAPSGGFALAPIEPEPSPWAQLTDPGPGDTALLERDSDTPAPPAHRALRVQKPRRGPQPVPLWMSAALLVCVVLLTLIGIGAVAKVLVR